MSTPLQQFLAQMAVDPTLYKRYLEDPDGVMREAGVSPEDQAALKSRNVEALVARIGCGQSFGVVGYGLGYGSYQSVNYTVPLGCPGPCLVGMQPICIPIFALLICPPWVVFPQIAPWRQVVVPPAPLLIAPPAPPPEPAPGAPRVAPSHQ
jgi:hypothetical protein